MILCAVLAPRGNSPQSSLSTQFTSLTSLPRAMMMSSSAPPDKLLRGAELQKLHPSSEQIASVLLLVVNGGGYYSVYFRLVLLFNENNIDPDLR